MQATVTVDVNIEHARTALRMAGFKVDGRSDEEICEMAIKRNDCYAVETKNIVLETQRTEDIEADKDER